MLSMMKRIKHFPFMGALLLCLALFAWLAFWGVNEAQEAGVSSHYLGSYAQRLGMVLWQNFGMIGGIVPIFPLVLGLYFCYAGNIRLSWRHCGAFTSFIAVMVGMSIFLGRIDSAPNVLLGGLIGAFFVTINWVVATTTAIILIVAGILAFGFAILDDLRYTHYLLTGGREDMLAKADESESKKSVGDKPPSQQVADDVNPFDDFELYPRSVITAYDPKLNDQEHKAELHIHDTTKRVEQRVQEELHDAEDLQKIKPSYEQSQELGDNALEHKACYDCDEVSVLKPYVNEDDRDAQQEGEGAKNQEILDPDNHDDEENEEERVEHNPFVHPLLPQHRPLKKPSTPLPSLDLMGKPHNTNPSIDEDALYETSQRIERLLADFGVRAKVKDVLIGAVVTRYEIELDTGVKSSKVMGLSSELSRALGVKVRITEVVPHKPYMGIETPNRNRQTVWLYDLLASTEFQQSKAKLPLILGQDIAGKPVVIDLIDAPHLLVAGQTKAGKSVGLNAMIISLLYKLTPKELRMVMVDPKAVELEIYNHIPHLVTPVIDGAKEATNALKWAVTEMERRYQLLKHLGVRNMESYNEIIEKSYEMNYPIPDPSYKGGQDYHQKVPTLEKMYYLVLIIDEFGDLMATGAKEIEQYIVRLAQKSRAAGIHLILATQRPSADVITGLIKANLPSRIAFTVASGIDSRTILDKMGAESLLGRGDMLYSGSTTDGLLRVHGAFMTDDDVAKVANDWRAREAVNYIEGITASDEAETESEIDEDELDPLFYEAHKFMSETKKVSISSLQTRFAIGFPRAAKIVNQLEHKGIVSGANAGKRDLLVEYNH